MHRWQVGDVEVVRVEDDDFVLPGDRAVPPWAVPAFATDAGEVGIAFSAIAVADGDRRTVIDPWLANDGPRSGPTADAARHVDGLLDRLADAGFPAASIDTVVNTHWDGDGWNTRPDGDGRRPDHPWSPAFPNARYLWPEAELALLEAGSHRSSPDGLAALDRAGVLAGVEPGTRIADHVEVVDAPGHQDGHLAVRIAAGGDLAVVPGHLILSPLQVDDPSIAADEDPEVATTTRRAILTELADRHGLLVTTLMGGPGGGYVSRAGPDSFRLDPA